MINLIKSIIFLTLLFASQVKAMTTDEACPDEIYDVVAHAMKIKVFSPRSKEGNIVSESCKTWPYKERILLASFAYDAGVEYEKKLVVVMFDKVSQRVVSSLQETFSEDAIDQVGENSFTFDTARYQLTKDVRAFGLRFKSVAPGPSCGEAHWSDELTLLVPEGRKLRPILKLNGYYQQSIQGCLSGQSKHAIWQDAMITIDVEKSSTNGFFDLAATASITYSSNGASLKKFKAHKEQFILRYNGESYEKGKNSPWWLGSW